MSEAENQFAFENFPRGPLEFKVDRRKFFTAMKTAILVRHNKRSGGIVLKLADLGDLPDDELGQVIPMIIPGTQIERRQDHVWGKSPGSKEFIELFPAVSPAYTTYCAFIGLMSVEQIASYISLETDWDAARCFAYARGVFLYLVWVGIAQPRLPR